MMRGRWTSDEDAALRRLIGSMTYKDIGAVLSRDEGSVKQHARRAGMCRVTRLPMPERFWVNVDKSGTCWLWTGPQDRKGYGDFRVRGVHSGAHRFAYELIIGPIPQRLFVLHRCDNSLCVNPDHLVLGTGSDKMVLAIAKGRYGDAGLPLKERITRRIVVTQRDCWEWQGHRTGGGYGVINTGGVRLYVHRLMWELTHSPVPDGMLVCHHCDNPPCCNPDHLFLGTPKDNTQDMMRKGRARGYFARRSP